jgi:hypothetical protein
LNNGAEHSEEQAGVIPISPSLGKLQSAMVRRLERAACIGFVLFAHRHRRRWPSQNLGSGCCIFVICDPLCQIHLVAVPEMWAAIHYARWLRDAQGSSMQSLRSQAKRG